MWWPGGAGIARDLKGQSGEGEPGALCEGRGGTASVLRGATGSSLELPRNTAQGAKHVTPWGHLAVPLRLLFWRSLWDSSSFLPTTVRLAAMVERGCLHNT